MPKRLYKYQALTIQTLANLSSRTLWFSAPIDFNDPFDCAAVALDTTLSDVDAERAFELYRKRVADPAEFEERYRKNGAVSDSFREELLRGSESALQEIRDVRRGVACLAETWNDLLMWAHYANGHRGVCLEFDASADPFSKARKVVYSPSVPLINSVRILTDKSSNELTEALYLTKSAHWGYEKEWRLLHMTERTAYTYPWQTLTGVYLGSGIAEEHAALVALVLQGSPTQLYNVKRSNGAFSLSAERVKHLPFDYKAGGLTGVAG